MPLPATTPMASTAVSGAPGSAGCKCNEATRPMLAWEPAEFIAETLDGFECLDKSRVGHGLPSCRKDGRSYNAPVLDIKLIREKPDFVRHRLATRGAGDETQIDALLKLDEQRRKLLAEVETFK